MPEDNQPAPGSEDADLPPELKGKSKKEILDYMLGREVQIKGQYEAKLADAQQTSAPTPNNQPAKPTAADFWTDPSKAAELTARTVIAEEFGRLTTGQQSNMVQVAKLVASNKFKDWARFAADIEKTMALLPPAEQANSTMWETTYWHIKGINADRLYEEGMNKGRQMSAEGVQTQAPNPGAPPTLKGQEAEVAKGLGIADNKWLESKKNLEEGRPWPMAGLK